MLNEIHVEGVIAARWQREGRGGYLQPLRVSLELNLSDLVGVAKKAA